MTRSLAVQFVELLRFIYTSIRACFFFLSSRWTCLISRTMSQCQSSAIVPSVACDTLDQYSSTEVCVRLPGIKSTSMSTQFLVLC